MRWFDKVPRLAIAFWLASSLPVYAGSGAAVAIAAAGTVARTGTVFVIHLEQRKDGKPVEMYPSHVFEVGDVVRFRVTAKGFGGYLYVIEKGTSGTYTTLYPATGMRQAAAANTILQADQDAFVPAVEDGWFQVDGPAGFDLLYFVVSPKPIDIASGEGEKGNAAGAAPVPDSLRPRCNDAIFQARGECVDDSAGPAALPRDVPLPPQISAAAQNASRDIVFDEGSDDHAVKATAPLDKPAVYVFRLAHR